jgi:hypothetical protein
MHDKGRACSVSFSNPQDRRANGGFCFSELMDEGQDDDQPADEGHQSPAAA